MSMNQVNLIGNLARDAEIKTTASGKNVATFTLAVGRNFKNAEGNYEADFINIVAWDKQAGVVERYTAKGSQVSVSGRLQIRSYDANDGTKRYVTEIIANEIGLLSSGQKQSQAPKKQTNEYPEVEDDSCPF